jgi:hypothetical protein
MNDLHYMYINLGTLAQAFLVMQFFYFFMWQGLRMFSVNVSLYGFSKAGYALFSFFLILTLFMVQYNGIPVDTN